MLVLVISEVVLRLQPVVPLGLVTQEQEVGSQMSPTTPQPRLAQSQDPVVPPVLLVPLEPVVPNVPRPVEPRVPALTEPKVERVEPPVVEVAPVVAGA